MIVNRYAYKNTSSSAGSGIRYDIETDDIVHINKWYNYYGNPSYNYFMRNGDNYYLVDDYGAMNDIGHMSAHEVSRKKDLF